MIDTSIIDFRRSIFEGRHIDHRSSKVDFRSSIHRPSIFEGRHIDLRRSHSDLRKSTRRSSKVDTSAAGGIKELRRWWDLLVRIGPNYGYYPNASKTWLIVKPDSLLWAQTAFKESGVSITSEGRKHLGAAIGTEAFRRSCYKKVGQLDSGGHEAYSHRRIPTTCCIRGIHSQPLLKVELPFPNHRRHRRTLHPA